MLALDTFKVLTEITQHQNFLSSNDSCIDCFNVSITAVITPAVLSVFDRIDYYEL